jgi:hypothetical protein
MGTELRFLKQKKLEGFESNNDAEYWHGKALEISVKFLPGDCPLVKHIVASYKKNHSPSSETIPENDEVATDIKVIKPFKGVDVQRVSPIIKNISNPAVKLSPLDLEQNNYEKEFMADSPRKPPQEDTQKIMTETKVKMSAREDNSNTEKEQLKDVSYALIIIRASEVKTENGGWTAWAHR